MVVRPPGAGTGLLLARADGDEQRAAVGAQFAGRVGLFLRVDDFDAAYERMTAAGVEFLSTPRVEPYGRVAPRDVGDGFHCVARTRGTLRGVRGTVRGER